MNTLLKMIMLLCSMASAEIINQSGANQSKQSIDNSQADNSPRDRKLVFSPYVLPNDLSAQNVGAESSQLDQGPQNPMLGPFQNSPMPAYGMGGMTPPSLGLTNMPYNYMYNSPMAHPMSNMHGQMMNSDMGFHMNEDELSNPSFSEPRELTNWGELPKAQVRVGSYCKNVRKQAVELANAIMKKQNRIIFNELVNYLLKSKYLIGMTEVKLTRVLRKKIYGLMNEYSNINQSNVQFIPVKENVVVQKQIVYQKSEDSPTDNRKLNTRRGRK